MSYKDHLYALIMAGGGGTRLWPKSRNKTPKQFLPLFKGKSGAQITVKRLRKILGWDRIFIVTVSEEYKKIFLAQIPRLRPENIIVEPSRRNTGPAHGTGATYILKLDPDAVIITESADRLVSPEAEYLNSLSSAAKLAYEKRVLIAVGVKPEYPHTGLGHIRKGKKVGKGKQKFFELDKFVEKPPLKLAKKFTSSGEYLWNAGQYVWRADSLLDAINKLEPKVGRSLSKIGDAIGTSDEKSTVLKEYKQLPLKTSKGKPMSVDYLVSERMSGMLALQGEFSWVDVGDWKDVWDNLEQDSNGNVIIDGEEAGGRSIDIESKNSLVHTNGKLLVTIGLEDVVVVDTKDALLVTAKDRAQDVKKVVNRLREEKRDELL